MTTFSIILAEDVRVDPRRHAITISTILNVPLVEARMLIHRSRGIFADHLTEEHARAISHDLSEDHVKHWMADEAALPPLPPLRKITTAEYGEDMFTYRPSQATEMEAMAWEDIAVVSCGAVVRIMHPDFVTTIPFEMIPGLHTLGDDESKAILQNGMVRMATEKKSKSEEEKNKSDRSLESLLDELDTKYTGKATVVMDLLNKDTTEHLRVPMEQFGYAPTEGARKVGGPWGLRHFLQTLRKKSPATAMTPVTLHFLNGSDIHDVLFTGMEEFNRFTAWFVHRQYCQQHLGAL